MELVPEGSGEGDGRVSYWEGDGRVSYWEGGCARPVTHGMLE